MIGRDAGVLRFGQKQLELVKRQGHGDGAHHFFLDPCGDGALATLPFDDGLRGAAAQPLRELIASEAARLAQGKKKFWFHG